MGPPMSAVKMPMGRSAKGIRVRSSRSAMVMSKAPPKAEAGSRILFSGLVMVRSRCGMIRPTKPIRPANDTALGGEHGGGTNGDDA